MTKPKTAYKGVRFNASYLGVFSDDSSCLLCLSQREIQLLMSALTPAKWETRWEGFGGFNELETVARLERKLMSCLDIFLPPDEPGGGGGGGGAGAVYAVDCKLYQGDRFIVDLAECSEENIENPPVGEEEIEEATDEAAHLCAAVDNIVQELLEKANDWLDILDAVASVADSIGDILQDLFNDTSWAAGFVGRILNLGGEVISIGSSIVRSNLNDAGYEDELRCSLYNALVCENGGLFDAEIIRDTILPGTSFSHRDLIKLIADATTDRYLFVYWQTGLTGESTYCEQFCDPCPVPWLSTWVFNDTNTLQQWVRRFGTLTAVGLEDEYVSSVGARLTRATIEFEDSYIEAVTMVYDQTLGSSDEPLTSGIRAYTDGYGNTLQFDERGTIPDGTDAVVNYYPEKTLDAIEMTINPMNRVSGDGGGSATIKQISIAGVGTKPVGWP